MKQNVLYGLVIATATAVTSLPAVAQQMQPEPAGCGAVMPLESGVAGHCRIAFADHGPAEPGLAARLSTMETYLGITTDQAAVWRSYSGALLAFSEGVAPDDERRPATASRAATGPAEAPSPLLRAERMAEQAIAQGQRGEALKSASAALREALSPAQLERLIALESPQHRPSGGTPHAPHPGSDRN